MYCLMHYIVFYIKDYETTADEVIREIDINILQNGETRAQLSIKRINPLQTIKFGVTTTGTSIPSGIACTYDDFKEPTAFQTIGKDGNIYGIYEQRGFGISIEVSMAATYVVSVFDISSNAGLMKGSSEEDEVAVCPTVKVNGNFDGRPVKLIISHCAELSPAALKRNVKMFVYTKLDIDSEGEGKVSRRQLAPPECEITIDTLSFCIDGPGLYTASLKEDMCEGKRVALLAFLPLVMPKNRKPILHVNFYHPFGEIGKRIREQWEEKDNVCVKDETTFILRNIGQDAEVTLEMLSLKGKHGRLISELEPQTLDNVPYECVDFKLDYNREESNELTIKLRVIQEGCSSEIDIRQTLAAPEPEPVIRIPKPVTDQMIDAISGHEITKYQLFKLANALGFSNKDFGNLVLDNASSVLSKKGYTGIKTLLTKWRNRTDEEHQRPKLKEAFKTSNLVDLTKMYLNVKDDFLN
eukprot:XP_011672828.1 PREDICTED: uncharacterized protein LOC105442433 [Strongylocentrotus purpuratus]